ncbi:hypothetical protein ECG_06195 [Echinococcus granulosus]|uniref:Ovule protein n=1 Tax=Echinococcus granulosus TaxID=6210 RepID=A0A068WPZ3_ECHGR|nr:hypothetical protein ECG_06195 [Echinococcus granulosus]CDS19723.1 hypothetical protein EgrG_000505500 [Echinococcus granulosus]
MKESSLLLLSEGETSSSSKTMNPGTPHISPNHPSTSSKLEVDFVILLPQLLFITLLEVLVSSVKSIDELHCCL